MRYHALATDYDGTIATHGQVPEAVVQALQRFRESGRKLILVTGRELPELRQVFPHIGLFDRIVAENGALLYRPQTKDEKVLCAPPPETFVNLLRQRGVTPLSVGRSIVATFEPNETVVLQTIRDLGLELQVIFNKGAVMVLPSGVNKATGLTACLIDMGLSARNVVAVGDAENDHAFLDSCECAVAVANALPALKDTADLITQLDHGAGVAELMGRLMVDDLKSVEATLTRRNTPLGIDENDREVSIAAYGSNVLIAGANGSGKTPLVVGCLQRLMAQGYQICAIHPTGQYADLESAVVFGDAKRPPAVDAIVQALDQSQTNVVVSLAGITAEERPAFFQRLFPALVGLRARTGRPHWIVLHDAHRYLQASWQTSAEVVPTSLSNILLVTTSPSQLVPVFLKAVDVVITSGPTAAELLTEFSTAVGRPLGPIPERQEGESLGWRCESGEIIRLRPILSKKIQTSELKKPVIADLPSDRSFYFEGPDKKLRLRAQNLEMFLQLADGIDDDTWTHHLNRHDYSTWFRTQLNDVELSAAAAQVEADSTLTPAESRSRIRAIAEQRYPAPAHP